MRAVQEQKLRQILKKNSNSRFGKDCKFIRLREYRDFRDAVPITGYQDYEPYVEAMIRGEQHQLTEERVNLLEPTGGTDGASKLIPYTAGLQREFMAGVQPWLADLYANYRSLKNGTSYWSISPLGNWYYWKESAIPIGFEDDSDYFGPLGGILQSIYPVPKQVRGIREMENFRFVTTLLLLRAPGLRLISVWNPSFLTILTDYIDENRELLTKNIRDGMLTWPREEQNLPHLRLSSDRGRASQLSRAFAQSDWTTHVWPRLSLISCWTDGESGRLSGALQRRFPGVPIQGKGLLATEGIVSFPLISAGGSVLAYRSHFYEFVTETGDVLQAHELEPGMSCSPLLTTSGGLYRYKLGDRVSIEGFYRELPVLRFLGRERTSDLVGEKITELFAAGVLNNLFAGDTPDFALLAPLTLDGSYHYGLFYDGGNRPLPRRAELDRLLAENFHYAYARRLGQLQEVEIRPVRGEGNRIFHDFQMKKGKKAGDIKLVRLYLGTDIEDCFPRREEDAHYAD